jgi:hypothetical protein
MQDDSQLLGYLPQYIPDNDQELITPANLRFVLAAFVEGKVNHDQLAEFAQLVSPRFSGVPQVPTAPAGTNSDQVASTAYVLSAIANVAGGKNLSELVLEQDVQGGNWYLTSTGIWEGRRNFHAVADPVNGPNWRLVAGFGGQLTSIPAANITDATDAGRAMLTASSAAVQRGLVGNMNIPAGKWGNHPALLTEDGPDGGWAYVLKALSTLSNVQVVQQSGAPKVTGFLPASGAVGDTVTITGSLFTKAKALTFNGTAAIFQVINDTTIVATLPAGATTGPVAVANENGTGTSAANFTVIATAAPTPAGDTIKPDVSFTVPAAGATLAPNTQVLLTVIANDNVAVQGLTFTNGATGAVIGAGAKNGSTYTFPYTTGDAGPLSLVATATDAAGNSQSATVNVTVQASNTTPPISAALTAALAISVASIVAGNPLTFEVTAGGGTAPYAYAVKATNNATGAVTILGASATGSFTPTAAGVSYNIDATVTDAAGKVAQASTRTVQVTAAQTVNQLPVANAGDDLTITAPTSSVALMGNATDPDPGDSLTCLWRPIAGPNTPLGLPATTLNVVVSNLIPGTYQFGFQATDNHGAKSTEDFVVVTVQAAVSTGNSVPVPLNRYRTYAYSNATYSTLDSLFKQAKTISEVTIDGEKSYTPGANYNFAIWIADLNMQFFRNMDQYSAAGQRVVNKKFLDFTGADFQTPHRINLDNTAQYKPFSNSLRGSLSSPLYLAKNIAYTCKKINDYTDYSANKAKIDGMIDAIPKDSLGFPVIPDVAEGAQGTVAWGFMESFFNSGRIANVSWLLYEVYCLLVEANNKIGNYVDAQSYADKAANFKAAFNDPANGLWNDAIGMCMFATIKNKERIDINSTCLAYEVGLLNDANSMAAATYIDANYDNCQFNGYPYYVPKDNEYLPGVQPYQWGTTSEGLVTSVFTKMAPSPNGVSVWAYGQYQQGNAGWNCNSASGFAGLLSLKNPTKSKLFLYKGFLTSTSNTSMLFPEWASSAGSDNYNYMATAGMLRGCITGGGVDPVVPASGGLRHQLRLAHRALRLIS